MPVAPNANTAVGQQARGLELRKNIPESTLESTQECTQESTLESIIKLNNILIKN